MKVQADLLHQRTPLPICTFVPAAILQTRTCPGGGGGEQGMQPSAPLACDGTGYYLSTPTPLQSCLMLGKAGEEQWGRQRSAPSTCNRAECCPSPPAPPGLIQHGFWPFLGSILPAKAPPPTLILVSWVHPGSDIGSKPGERSAHLDLNPVTTPAISFLKNQNAVSLFQPLSVLILCSFMFQAGMQHPGLFSFKKAGEYEVSFFKKKKPRHNDFSSLIY